MVNLNDTVDLDPEPGDILLVWGLEVTDQNIKRYICPTGQHGKEKQGSEEAWKQRETLGLLEDSLGLSFLNSRKESPYIQEKQSQTDFEAEATGNPHVSFKNPHPLSHFYSRGLEDVVISCGLRRSEKCILGFEQGVKQGQAKELRLSLEQEAKF